MKNKLLGIKILSVILCFALSLFLIPGCGEDGGIGGAKSSSGVSKKKPVASFRAYVDVEKGTITFEYPDASKGVKKTKGSAKKQYTSAGSGYYPLNVIMASTGLSWDSGTKILSGNVTITNNNTNDNATGDTLYGTYATIESISVGGVSVNNEYGYDPNGYPYFNHAPDGVSIAPGVTGSAVSWKFYDPSAVSFNFSGNVYADNWHQIAGDGVASTAWEDGSAEVADKLYIPDMIGFDNKLYIMLGKQPNPPRDTGRTNDYPGGSGSGTGVTGCEIWEYEPTGGTFTQVNNDGFGGSQAHLNKSFNNWGGCFAEFGGYLYAGTGKAIFGSGYVQPAEAGGEIWKWSGSGTTWTMVHSFTDSQGIGTLHSFDGSLFAGSNLRGYGRGSLGVPTSARVDYSTNGTTWIKVMTNAFGDTDENNTSGYGSTINSVANVSFDGSNTYSFIQKSGVTGKPGVTLYRAGPADGTGKGRLASQWLRITDNTADDIYATVTGVTYDNNPANAGVSGKYLLTVTFSSTPADHALAHHQAFKAGRWIDPTWYPERNNVHIMDNVGSQIVYAVASQDHTPMVGDYLRLTKGPNERGYNETANATSSMLIPFATSSEGSVSPADPNSLWVFTTSGPPQGVNQYAPSGGNIYSTTTGGSGDSDWIRRMDFFTYLDYPTPSSSGGAQYGGNVSSPVSVGAGFGSRTNFGFFPGAHEGWLYFSVLPYQTDNSGFRLYKTADGVNWIKITEDGFGDNWGAPRAFVSLGGKFYMSKSRPASSTGINGSGGNSIDAISPAMTTFYENALGSTPSIHFPTSGTLIMDKTFNADPGNNVPESTILVEKVSYTGNKIETVNTLEVALPLNDGTLATHLWALDSQIIANSIDSLPTGGGAIQIEGEIIQYSSISGSTISIASRGTFGTPVTTLYERGTRGTLDHGRANHAKGTPIYRTTKHGASDYFIVLSGVTGIPCCNDRRFIIIDNEKIWYADKDVTVTSKLVTPMRGIDATTPSAHSVGTTIYKGGWTGITRGLYGTTATSWASGESVTPVSFGSAELWVTD